MHCKNDFARGSDSSTWNIISHLDKSHNILDSVKKDQKTLEESFKSKSRLNEREREELRRKIINTVVCDLIPFNKFESQTFRAIFIGMYWFQGSGI